MVGGGERAEGTFVFWCFETNWASMLNAFRSWTAALTSLIMTINTIFLQFLDAVSNVLEMVACIFIVILVSMFGMVAYSFGCA